MFDLSFPPRTPNFMWYNLPTLSYSYHTTSPKLPLAWLSDFASDQNGPPSTLALITDQDLPFLPLPCPDVPSTNPSSSMPSFPSLCPQLRSDFACQGISEYLLLVPNKPVPTRALSAHRLASSPVGMTLPFWSLCSRSVIGAITVSLRYGTTHTVTCHNCL